MSPAPAAVVVDAQTDVVLVDANATVRTLVQQLLSGAGLRVASAASAAQLELASDLGTANPPPVVLLDLSADPAAVIDLGSLLPAALRRPDRLVVTSVRPALVASFSAQGASRPWGDLLERPFSPQTLARVLSRWFPDLAFGTSATATDAATSSHADDWARLAEQLRRQQEGSVTIPASRGAALRVAAARTGAQPEPAAVLGAPGGTPSGLRRRHSQVSADLGGFVDMSDEAQVVLDAGTDELDAIADLDASDVLSLSAQPGAEGDGEPVFDDDELAPGAGAGSQGGVRAPLRLDPIDLDDPASSIVSVDVSFDPIDASAIERMVDEVPPLTGAIEVVTAFELDVSEIARRVARTSGPVTAEAPIVLVEPHIALMRRDGMKTAEAPVVDERLDPHRAATRVAAALDLPPEDDPYAFDDEEIEELPPEFVVSMDRDDYEAVALADDGEGRTPPAPSRFAEVVDDGHAQGAAADDAAASRSVAEWDVVAPVLDVPASVMPLCDVLAHVEARGLRGVVRVRSPELVARIFVDDELVHWIERCDAHGEPLGLASALAETGLCDVATLEAVLAELGDESQLPEALVARGVVAREALFEAMHWQAMQLGWALMGCADAHLRLELELTAADRVLLSVRPTLQLGITQLRLAFYRNFPVHAPLSQAVQRPGMWFVTDAVGVHRASSWGLLPEERWLLEVLGEPRSFDGLLELVGESSEEVERMVRVLARLCEFGLVVALRR